MCVMDRGRCMADVCMCVTNVYDRYVNDKSSKCHELNGSSKDHELNKSPYRYIMCMTDIYWTQDPFQNNLW